MVKINYQSIIFAFIDYTEPKPVGLFPPQNKKKPCDDAWLNIVGGENVRFFEKTVLSGRELLKYCDFY